MHHTWDGFYAAYMTGIEGQGFAMFIFSGGRIIGADPLGVLFDGTYDTSIPDRLVATVTVNVPPGDTVIQGASAGPSGLSYEVPLIFAGPPTEEEVVRLETPLGPVNLKLRRLRGPDYAS